MTTVSLVHYFFENLFILFRAVVYVEVFNQAFVPGPHLPAEVRTLKQLNTSLPEELSVVQGDQVASLIIAQYICLAAVVVADDRESAVHSLEKYQAEPFMLAGGDEHVRHLKELELLQGTHESHEADLIV